MFNFFHNETKILNLGDIIIYNLRYCIFSEILQNHRNRHGFLEQELREAFETFDEDCDGYIDTTELIKVLTVLGKDYPHTG